MNLDKSHQEITNNMGFCSIVPKNPNLLFGGYPGFPEMQKLQEEGVKYIIDLTTPHEKRRLDVYHAKEYQMMYANFPIEDNFVPRDMNAFHEFIMWLSFTVGSMKPNEKMYIHCKGGHGRSGLIVACLLCIHYNYTSSDAIAETTEAHRLRPELAMKWKTRMCPSNSIQRLFVHRISQMSSVDKRVCADPISQDLENAMNSARKRLLQQQHQTTIMTSSS